MAPSKGKSRRSRIHSTPVTGSRNAMWEWVRHRHPIRVALQYAVIVICRISPSLRLKNALYRRLGMSVGSGVAWGLEATPDVLWPELITIGENAIIGYDATILCHEFLRDECRVGPVEIGPGVMIGAGAIILPGVEIGENARVMANSVVTGDVPADATVAGIPATEISSDADQPGA